MSTHWLDCPFLTASQVRMVKQTIACPSRVLFFAVERDQDAPAQVKKKNPNLKAKFLFRICKINCIACICPWAAGVPLSECHLGGYIGGSDADSTRLGRRKPKRTPAVVIDPKRTQVGARSTSTWRGFCNGGAGDALRLKQRKLHLHAPVRLPDDSRPVIFWGLEKVEDKSFWQHLGSPRHLMYIARPFGTLIAL